MIASSALKSLVSITSCDKVRHPGFSLISSICYLLLSKCTMPSSFRISLTIPSVLITSIGTACTLNSFTEVSSNLKSRNSCQFSLARFSMCDFIMWHFAHDSHSINIASFIFPGSVGINIKLRISILHRMSSILSLVCIYLLLLLCI